MIEMVSFIATLVQLGNYILHKETNIIYSYGIHSVYKSK